MQGSSSSLRQIWVRDLGNSADPVDLPNSFVHVVALASSGWEPIVESWYMQRLDMGLGLSHSSVALHQLCTMLFDCS